MESLYGAIGGLLLSFLLMGSYLIAKAGGLSRALWGLRLAGRAHRDSAFAGKVDELLTGSSAATPPPKSVAAKPSGEPLRLLSLLQGEARLLDFLLEDISAFDDSQVGQAVRDIHRKAQTALKQHLVLEPVIASTEGHVVTVQPGFDPSAIRVLGNVTGQPPYTGELQHAGWRVREFKLPPAPSGQDLFVLQPAEVQLP